jgi:carbohydrate kinase (thermoresistant glucokinase family)
MPRNSTPAAILVVMGVSGCGKTTIGNLLAQRLGWTFKDADWFHPASNIDKMEKGIPLTDDDRWPWLEKIAVWIGNACRSGERGVIACSALKRRYRELLMSGEAQTRLVFLVIPHDADEARIGARHGHFFPQQLLDSQYATLELPDPAAEPGVFLIPATGAPDQTADEIIRTVIPAP